MQGKPVEQEWKKWCEFLTTNPMPASTMLNVPKEAFEAGYLAASVRLATYEAALREIAELLDTAAGRASTKVDPMLMVQTIVDSARKALEDNK